MDDPVVIHADGIEIEANRDIVEARQNRIYSIIKACCEQFGGSASVTYDKLANALTDSGIRSDRRHVANALLPMLQWGHITRQRHANHFYYWVPDPPEEEDQYDTQPMLPLSRGGIQNGGLAGVSAVTAQRRLGANQRQPTEDERRIILEAAAILSDPTVDISDMTGNAAAGEPLAAFGTGDMLSAATESRPAAAMEHRPAPAGNVAEQPADRRQEEPEWICPDHPNRTPKPSRYNYGELYCPAKIGPNQHCRNTNLNTRQLGQHAPGRRGLPPEREIDESRTGYIEEGLTYGSKLPFMP